MKMVASARVKRAENTLNNSRKYMNHFASIIAHLFEAELDIPPHPLQEIREDVGKVAVLVLSSDRGLCGSYNTNVVRAVEHYAKEETTPLALYTVGRKSRDYFRRRDWNIAQSFIDISFHIEYKQIKSIVDAVSKAFLSGEVDRVMMAGANYHTPAVCRPFVKQLLPLEPPRVELEEHGARDYIFQPNAKEVLDTFFPQYLHISVVTAVAEAITCEQGQRMVAMTAATENAGEMIRALTLRYNKARQASITAEILEIVGGAEALK